MTACKHLFCCQMLEVFMFDISMAKRNTAVTPLLMHWSYCSLAISRRWLDMYSNCSWLQVSDFQSAGIILCMGSANERRRYNVTSSLIGWVHSQNDPWVWEQPPSCQYDWIVYMFCDMDESDIGIGPLLDVVLVLISIKEKQLWYASLFWLDITSV